MSKDALEEFQEALEQRLAIGLDVVNGTSLAEDTFKFKNPSIVRDQYFLSRDKAYQVNDRINTQNGLLSLILSQDTFSAQLRNLRILSKRNSERRQYASLNFTAVTYINWDPSEVESGLDHSFVRSRLDGSLVHQNRALCTCPFSKFPKTLNLLEEFMKRFLHEALPKENNVDLIDALVAECNLVGTMENMKDARRGIVELKRTFWYIIGVEIFNCAQLLLSHVDNIDTNTYQRLRCIFKTFQAMSVFENLALLRTLSGDLAARELILKKEETEEISNNIPSGGNGSIHSGSGDFKNTTKQIFANQSPFLKTTLSQLIDLEDEITKKDLPEVINVLAKIHQSDTETLYFVNWTKVHRLFNPEKPAKSVDELFAATLFLKFCQFQKHPAAATSKGQGFLIAKLGKAINDSRFVDVSTKVEDLARRISKLDKANSLLIATTILNRDVLRLVPYFGRRRSSSGKNNDSRLDRQVSDLRFQLAESLYKRGIISKSLLAQCTVEELEYLKLLHFYEQDRQGRIRISWNAIERYIHDLLTGKSANLFFELAILRSEASNQVLVDIAAEDVAHDISSQVLFLADSSLDWCLSNYIRHGHIETTFLGGVYAAIDSYARVRGFDQRDDIIVGDKYSDNDEIRKIFKHTSEQIIRFIQRVSDSVDQYKNDWTTLEFDGPTNASLKSHIYDELAALNATSDRSDVKISDTIKNLVSLSKSTVDRFLEGSRTRLNEFLRPDLLLLVNSLKEEISGNAEDNISVFFDSLTEEMSRACDSVDAWLHQNQSNLVANDFRVSDIVRYLLSTVFSAYGQSAPVSSSSRMVRQDGSELMDPEIDGVHFDFFFQILFNAMQNALIHSGNGRNTECEIRIVFTEKDLTMRIASILSKERAQEVIDNYDSIVETAKNIEPSELAYEGGSGIAKIKRTARTALNTRTLVNIPHISRSKRRFLIEYKFFVGHSRLLKSEAVWRTS